MKKKKIIYIIMLILLLVSIDFISKIFVINFLKNDFIIINNFLKFTYLKNSGAAFGILSGNIIFLILITIFFIYYIIVEMKNNINNKLPLISYILILSGACGNLIDRVLRKYVVDFISFKIFGKDMAIFNIADIYITFGVFLLFFIMIKEFLYARNSSK